MLAGAEEHVPCTTWATATILCREHMLASQSPVIIIHNISIFYFIPPHFFSSVSSRLTQIAAIIAKSTPGAHLTKYVCLSAKISRMLKKLLEMCATACPPQVISADRSNQSPLTSISTGRPSAAFLNTTWDFVESTDGQIGLSAAECTYERTVP
jgi:hypothetical protein